MIYLILNVLTLHIIEFIKKDRVVRVIYSSFYIARTTSTKHPVLFPVFQAVLLAQDIRDRERGGRAQIGVVEGGDEQSSPELMQVMMMVLGQRSGPLKPATSDDRHELVQNSSIRLYQ